MSEKKFNHETEEAMKEAKEIASGIKEVKAYRSATELFEELDVE